MPRDTGGYPHYWKRYAAGADAWKKPGGGPPGHELAALRRGLGKGAGDVPSMWAFYSTLRADGSVSDHLRAEHVALTMFAVHQQSKRQPVHREGVRLGTAMLALRGSGKFSAEAVDRRFAAAATATSFTELAAHLRGLITQLRSVDPGGLDYTRLFWDLVNWQDPEKVTTVRLEWGSQYLVPAARNADGGDAGQADATPTPATDARSGG